MADSSCIFWQLMIFIGPVFVLTLLLRVYVFRMGYAWNQRCLAFLNLKTNGGNILYVGTVSNSILVNAIVLFFIGSFVWCKVYVLGNSILLATGACVAMLAYIFACIFIVMYIVSCVIIAGPVVYIRRGFWCLSVECIEIESIVSCKFYVNRIYNTVSFLEIETEDKKVIVTQIVDGNNFVKLIDEARGRNKKLTKSE